MSQEIFGLQFPEGTTNSQIAEKIVSTFATVVEVSADVSFVLDSTDRPITSQDAQEIDDILHRENTGLFFFQAKAGGAGAKAQDFYIVGRVLESGPNPI